MNNLIMYPHGGSYNHGCEAIVRTTVDIMSEVVPTLNDDKVLISMRPNEDIEFGINKVCKVLPQTVAINRFSKIHLKGVIKYYLLGDKEYYDRLAFRNVFENSDKNTLALSIGGDNYCYGRPGDIYFINKHVRKNNAKTILWGCSIEPSAMDEEMIADLKNYEFVFARESLTYNALLKNGVTGARLCPDPAFLLKTEAVELPEGFQENNTIGINLSPMIMSYESNEGSAFANYTQLIEYIIANTNYQIALIPHVMWNHNDDRIPLSNLYDKFKDTQRVIFIANKNDLNCMQLKFIISKCNMFIAARTHASIAAYSQCVPTLVVGYSVKALGIAKDLFGTDKGYVFPVQSLRDKNDLTNQFKEFSIRHKDMKQHLVKFIPEYKAAILKAAEEIKNLND